MNQKKNFCRMAFLLAGMVISYSSSMAQSIDTAAIISPIFKFVNAFNTRSPKLPDSTFAEDACVVDEFSPFVWSGAPAVSKWYDKLMGRTPEERQKLTAMQQHLSAEKPTYLFATTGEAYVVMPARLTFIINGKQQIQKALWVTTVRKTGNNWLITSNAWAIAICKEPARSAILLAGE